MPEITFKAPKNLAKLLSARELWAIMVGMVISGQYFGWNYGISVGGLYGFSLAVLMVIVFYSGFICVCTELSSYYPKAGGPSYFVSKAFGNIWGFIAAIACLIEFLFALPAIALSIGYYLNYLIPFIPAKLGGFIAFIIVLWINLMGISRVAKVELFALVIALSGLLIYYLCAAQAISEHSFQLPIDHVTSQGFFSAIPFAIWLFLAIEGGALSAEEVKHPKKNIPKSFISALFTIIGCTLLTVMMTVALGGSGIGVTDAPLTHVLIATHTRLSNWGGAFVATCGLFGLFASLNGITIGYSRLVFSMAKSGFLPKVFKRLSINNIPYLALLVPGIFVLLFSISEKLSKVLVILSVFGAVCLYILVLFAFFKLRADTTREALFRAPVFLAIVSLVLSVLFWLCIFFYSVLPAHIFFMGIRMSVVLLFSILAVVSFLLYLCSRLINAATPSV